MTSSASALNFPKGLDVKRESVLPPAPTTIYCPKELGKKKTLKKKIVCVCVTPGQEKGQARQAGDISAAELPFKRNTSFFTSVPKCF